MNKLHHPTNRAERLKIKAKKNSLVHKVEKPQRVNKKHLIEELEVKELDNEVREQVH